MPIYEYGCGKCSHVFEKLQKVSDQPLRTCPQCGADALSKLVSKTSFRLKGTGWYETDFKNNNAKPSSTTDATKASKTAATTGGSDKAATTKTESESK